MRIKDLATDKEKVVAALKGEFYVGQRVYVPVHGYYGVVQDIEPALINTPKICYLVKFDKTTTEFGLSTWFFGSNLRGANHD